jgi:hypothetical protein
VVLFSIFFRCLSGTKRYQIISWYVDMCQYFSYIMATSFSGGRSRSSRWELKQKSIPLTHIHDRLLFALVTGASIKSGFARLVLCTQTSRLSEIMRAWKWIAESGVKHQKSINYQWYPEMKICIFTKDKQIPYVW